MLPPEAAQSPTVHKIHILGEDARSQFIAHALSRVYDSVQLLSWKGRDLTNYPYVMTKRSMSELGEQRSLRGQERSPSYTKVDDDDSHIDHLMVTGHGHEAVNALSAVKHRVGQDTDIYLMNEGLGVLDHVRKKVFSVPASSPRLFLGHMTHKVAFNNEVRAVKELKEGELRLTAQDVRDLRGSQISTARPNLVEAMRDIADLNPSWAPYDEWLQYKLPSVLFGAAVEPICVLFDTPYQGIIQNPAAWRMVVGLLDEMILVLNNLPELRRSTIVRNWTRDAEVHKAIHREIRTKKSARSELSKLVSKGQPTDINYLNGYFLRRARRLGIDVPMNKLMGDMVKARHSRVVECLNSDIPFEEISIPSETSFKQRTSPKPVF